MATGWCRTTQTAALRALRPRSPFALSVALTLGLQLSTLGVEPLALVELRLEALRMLLALRCERRLALRVVVRRLVRVVAVRLQGENPQIGDQIVGHRELLVAVVQRPDKHRLRFGGDLPDQDVQPPRRQSGAVEVDQVGLVVAGEIGL